MQNFPEEGGILKPLKIWNKNLLPLENKKSSIKNFLSLWLNAGAQITHGGQVQRPRQNIIGVQ